MTCNNEEKYCSHCDEQHDTPKELIICHETQTTYEIMSRKEWNEKIKLIVEENNE